MDIIEKQKKRRNKIKYTVSGFNQIEAIKMGLSTDDLAVLRWFIDFKSTGAMEKTYIEEINDMGFWVDYSTLIDALPIILSNGNTYLQRFIELEQLLQDGKFKEYKEKKKKYHDTNRKKVQRILSGPLSQILKKDDMKILGNEKGSKIYIYLDEENYSKLLLNTNMETYLAENGINIEKTPPVGIVDNVDNIDAEKVVGDTSVSPVGDTSVSPVGDTSVSPDSSLSHSSVIYSLSSNSYTQSRKMDSNLKYFLENKNKELYLKNKFDITDTEYENILIVMDLGIEEGSIKSKVGSKGYWSYVYKTCKSIHEKKLTHNCSYELAHQKK